MCQRNIAPGGDDPSPARLPSVSGMEASIEVSGLRKRFGSAIALDGLSFTVQPGQVTGFVGPNGAGKSTTMRAILGLDALDEGTALVGGRPYRTLHRPLQHVGALLDAGALQASRTGRNHLLWLAHSQGLTGQRVDQVVEQVGLQSAAGRRAGGYSLGMRQRLGIAAALLGDPPILILDEPFNGLDPEGVVWIRTLLRSLADEGRAILVSSHLMAELQDTAGHLVVIGRGRLVADTSVAELIAAASGGHITVRTTERSSAMSVLANAGATVAVTGPDTLTMSGLAAGRVVALMNDAAVPFSEVSAHRATLEEAYMDLTRNTVEFRAGELQVGESRSATRPGAGSPPDDRHRVSIRDRRHRSWFRAVGQSGVDKVPDRAGLGDRPVARSGADRAARVHRAGRPDAVRRRDRLVGIGPNGEAVVDHFSSSSRS